MTYQELNEVRNKLGLTEAQMAERLRVALSTYTGWGTRGKVPGYIAAHVETIMEVNYADGIRS